MCSHYFLKAIAFVSTLLIAIPTPVWSQESSDTIQASDDLTVFLVDSLSRPIEGAKIGFSASYGDNSYQSPSWAFLPDPASLDRLPPQVLSDEDGIATLKRGKAIASSFQVSLVARHEGRRLVGIVNLPRRGVENLTLTLYPECKVTGDLVCPQLAEAGTELKRNWLNVELDGTLCIEHYSNSSEFELFLPPGEYSLTASGADEGTLIAKRTLIVSEGAAEMKLYPIQLSLKASRELAGLPAPELTNVIAWKGDGPKSLEDLRGKVVLLDFWGYWCGACVSKIPRLIELDNRYRDRGLSILGLHIDSGDKIISLSDYEAYAESLKEGILGGKDIPYPVALIAANPTPFVGNSAKNATCEIAAAYGVVGYPTMILIDRAGNIVGEFHDTPEALTALETLLSMPVSTDNSKPRSTTNHPLQPSGGGN